MSIRTDQRGLAPVLIVLVVVVVAAIAGTGYLVAKGGDKSDNSGDTAGNKLLQDECKKQIDDKDFCKFAGNFSLDDSYKMTMTTTTADGTSTTVSEVNGNNSSMVTTKDGQEVSAMIMLDDTTYVKDLTDGAWTKFSFDTPEEDYRPDEIDLSFDESDETEEADKTEYKQVGKEACGNLTCFKYQLIDPEAPSDEQFLWFDDKDYKLRRWTFKDENGTTDMTYEYAEVTISTPSPVKDAPSGL